METHLDEERIRAAVERNPRKMTLQLARDLGVPEVEVIRAFPADRVTELDISRWEELLRRLASLGPVRVLVSNGATTIEVDGQFGGFSTAGEFFNVQTDSLDTRESNPDHDGTPAVTFSRPAWAGASPSATSCASWGTWWPAS